MDEDSTLSAPSTPVELGATVYDESGTELGIVTELTDAGFEVSIDPDADAPADDAGADADPTAPEPRAGETEPGGEFGEGYLIWRCEECGETGDLDEGLPTDCPNCGSADVVKQRED